MARKVQEQNVLKEAAKVIDLRPDYLVVVDAAELTIGGSVRKAGTRFEALRVSKPLFARLQAGLVEGAHVVLATADQDPEPVQVNETPVVEESEDA